MNHIAENKLNSFIKNKKIKNILVITGKKSFNFSGFKKLKVYKNFKYSITILYKKNKIPEIKELNSIIKKINLINPDLIIALGGGCVLDYAKLANGLHNIKNLKKKIQSNSLKVKSKKTNILAIPTTAGSGAEMTRFSVMYINKIKYSVEHSLLKPDFYSLIPKLVINSSKIVRASSGFDAVAQALESIFSKKANIRSLKYSLKSLDYSIKNFLKFVNNPNSINAGKMQHAANLSGSAINIAKTNAPHALSYLFTSRFKIPHGIAVSIFFIEIINLYYFTAQNKNNIKLIKRFNLLFKKIKKNNISGFNNLFENFFLDSGIKKYLNKVLKKIRYQISNKFYFNFDRLNNSPIKILREDIIRLYLTKF